ncbi:MAG: hypothetical protein ACRC1H_08370, partial [Caldilineaceae bacterium]
MEPSRYQLADSREPQAPARRSAGRAVRIAATVALVALTLVVGALYGPLLLRTGSASAVQALQEQPSTPVAVPAINAALAADQEALATLFNAIVPSVVSIETAGEF